MIRQATMLVLAAVLLFPTRESKGVDCLQQMDSISYYLRTFPQRALVTSDSLLIAMQLEDCGPDSVKANIYNNLGTIFWELGDYSRADSAFTHALRVYINLYDSSDYRLMPLYLNFSGMHQELGHPIQAEKYLLLLNQAVRENYGYQTKEYIEALYRTGLFYLNSGDYDGGLKNLREAYEIASRNYAGNDSLRSRLLIEIGTAERILGNYAQSRSDLNHALTEIDGGEQIIRLMAIDRLAALKSELGEFAASESDLLSNLRKKYEQYPDDTLSLVETLNNLGLLYFRLNDLDLSKRYFTDAMRLSSRYTVIKSTLLNNLGTIFWREGQYKKAEEHFSASSEMFRQIYGAVHPDYANSLNNLAAIYNAEGNYEKALATYMKVLDIDDVLIGDEHPQFATTLNNIALVFFHLGQPEFAHSMLQRALSIRKKTLSVNHPLYAKTLNDLGIYYLITGDNEQALDHLDEALRLEINHMQDILPVLTNNQREQFFENIKYNVERFSSLAFGSNDGSWHEKALNYFINTKSVLFYAADKMRKAVQNSGNKELIELFQSWRAVKFKLAQVFLLNAEERQRQGVSVELLENQANELEKRLSQAFNVFADQTENHFYEWQTIREAMSDSVALVEILHYRKYLASSDSTGFNQGFVGKSNYVSFVLTKEKGLGVVQWDEAVDLERSYSYYLNSLKFKIRETLSYQLYWDNIDRHLEDIHRIYFAADGIFHKINPSIFYDETNDQFVADKYDIVTITSGKDLINLRKDQFKPNAAIFGNPAYQTLKLPEAIAALPEAEREADDITRILNGHNWQVNTMYYTSATEEKLKEMQNPGILHIATHGYFSEKENTHNPLFSSGLYMARAGENSPDDGILTAYEAMNLTLDETDLVVLSACETALGEIKNGEGVFGLQRAFLVAGANHLILSLVKVDDEATRTFMKLFYNALTESHQIEEAFFSSRDQFRKQFSNPYNWGAFIFLSN